MPPRCPTARRPRAAGRLQFAEELPEPLGPAAVERDEGEVSRPPVQFILAEWLDAQRDKELRAAFGGDPVSNRPALGSVGVLDAAVEHGEDLAGEGAGEVDESAPEDAGFPPAVVGGVGAEGEEDADGAAHDGEGEFGQGEELEAGEGVEGGDGGIEQEEDAEAARDAGPDADPREMVSNDHGAVSKTFRSAGRKLRRGRKKASAKVLARSSAYRNRRRFLA